jgi:hypothetical protein
VYSLSRITSNVRTGPPTTTASSVPLEIEPVMSFVVIAMAAVPPQVLAATAFTGASIHWSSLTVVGSLST